jgi:DUF4097 and DUF4098 domain-containing protein YvlB
MNRKCLCLSIVLMFAASLLHAASETDGKTYEYDTSPGQTIYFDLKSGGGVSIQGWDESTAEVTYVQRGEGHAHTVQIHPERGGLIITSDAEIHEGTTRDLEFKVRVPREYNVNFESMGGSLTISNLDGKFTGRTMGGGLTLREVDGTVKLTTMGGAIQVIGADLDGKLSTMGGTVYMKDVIGDLEAESMGGNVRYENVRGRDGKLRAPGGSLEGMETKTVTISTMGGDIEVDEAPAGAWVNTMGGDIDVENAREFVKASTMGGGIAITVTDGWVDASTMAGDVDVKIAGGLGEGDQGVSLSSYCGDISLALPGDLPMDLDLTISYTKNSSQDFKIISDFDLEIEHSKDWDYSNGSPRRRIHGTGTTGSGKYPIVIKTINGNIRLMKAE